MSEIGPQHPLGYRRELAEPLFQRIRSRESCVVMGAASMGKSRMLSFLLRADVQQHYLYDEANMYLITKVDCNRMREISELGLYELMLTSLISALGLQPQAGETVDLRRTLHELRREVIVAHNVWLAQRHLELAIQMLCREQGRVLCFLFDEFDETYQKLPAQTFANLRALRDDNKYLLGYVLFLRQPPAELRSPSDCEGFYELVSRTLLGLTPYSDVDTRRLIEQITTRRHHELDALGDEAIVELMRLGGNHPGLLVGMLSAFAQSPPVGRAWNDWAMEQTTVQEECRKLWESLSASEQRALNQLALEQGVEMRYEWRERLLCKGILVQNEPLDVQIFSPLFARYACANSAVANQALHIDLQTGVVWRADQQNAQLTDKEYELVLYLYEREGKICSVDEIIHALYPGESSFEISPNNISSLVRRVRSKIETSAGPPQHLLNFKGRGYMLVTQPKAADKINAS